MRTELVLAGGSCPGCGAPAPPAARFCPGCGCALAVSVPPAPPAPVLPAWSPGQATAPPVTLRPFADVRAEAIGHRAGARSWVVVALACLAFLAASIAVVLAAAASRESTPAASDPGSRPAARFDEQLFDGAIVRDGQPWEVEVEAVNRAPSATERLWLVIEWAPGGPDTGSVAGGFVACQPAGCEARDDAAAGRTIVSWPGLAPGGRRVLRVTVAVDGLVPGTTLRYRVRTGTGPSEPSMAGGNTWDLELDVE